jgi:hypothetical protein
MKHQGQTTSEMMSMLSAMGISFEPRVLHDTAALSQIMEAGSFSDKLALLPR